MPPGHRDPVLATDPTGTPAQVLPPTRPEQGMMAPLGALPDRRSARRLRGSAAAVARILARPAGPPGAWADPDLGIEVDRIRRQLLPIGSLAALAACWSREHAVLAAIVGGGRVPCAVRLAYAVRWLELSGVLDERPWVILARGSGR